MKKIAVLLMILALTLGAIGAFADASPLTGQSMPDFSCETTEGDTVSLSALLAENDLVVVNVFTSWCPPCRNEFPEMERVYEDNVDRMEIVALTDEPTDTLETIAAYKAELGLTFPMGLIAGTGVSEFIQVEGYPTSLFIGRNGVIAYYQLGSFATEAQFRSCVDYMLSDAYDGAPLGGYNVYVCDADYEPIPGAVVNFCTDTTCQTFTSDEDGIISFAGPLQTYHVQLLKAPDGYAPDADSADIECSGDGEWAVVMLTKE